MGKASVPKRGRSVKARPLRSDSQPRGMPKIALGKASKGVKLKKTIAKKGKVQLKPAKGKQPRNKLVADAEDSDTASIASARVRRSNAADNDASTSRSPNEPLDSKVSKKPRTSKVSLERSDSPASTRLSRSSSSSSLVVKSSEAKKGGKGNVGKEKGASSSPAAKGILKFFRQKVPPTLKESMGKKNTQASRKNLGNEAGISKKGMTSSPDSVNSNSNQSILVSGERSDINDDEQDVDNDDTSVDLLSEDLEAPKLDICDGAASTETISKSINGDNDVEKSIPKLTMKNINELFPSDDMTGTRLRSGSPASQKSTRSLTLLRNSPSIAAGSGVRYATRSDSAIRVLRNGKHSKVKRTSVFEGFKSDTSKKKRVYAGALKDEDKIEDSRSDFSDEQSSIFSESDSSSFIDTFSRLKNNELDDKMDIEELQSSMSNDEDDIGLGRMGSPIPQRSIADQRSDSIVVGKSNSTDHDEDVNTAAGSEDLLTTTSSGFKDSEEEKDSKTVSQLPKNNEILNNIQSDWDSDGEGNKDESDALVPKSPIKGHSAMDALMSDSVCPEDKVKEPTSDAGKVPNMKSSNDLNLEDVSDHDSVINQNAGPNSSTHFNSPSLSDSTPGNQSSTPVDPPDLPDPQSKAAEPILHKTVDKNGFADSVDFVAKKNQRIDFELLRRRTKRSMSFNMDAQDKGHSQRILSVEPNKVHGKPTLIWTVKAVREPIIPKTGKSPEKVLGKTDSHENRNISLVKPMMESVQNDHLSVLPKAVPDIIVANASFSLSSSSVKENILVQSTSKPSAGKSPVREPLQSGGILKSVKPTLSAKVGPDVSTENPLNGSIDKDKPVIVSPKESQKTPDSSLATTVKPSLDSYPTVDTDSAAKAGTPASPTPNVSLNSSSSDDLCNDVSLASAVMTPMRESNPEEDPVAPILASEQEPTTGEAAQERYETPQEKCETPQERSEAPQERCEIPQERCETPPNVRIELSNAELTPVDDGESFRLRLSPTPTKEETKANTTPAKEDQQSSVLNTEDSSEQKSMSVNGDHCDVTQDSAEIVPQEDQETTLPVEEDKFDEGMNISSVEDSQTIQLVRKKGPSSSRPRSRSADFSPTSLTFSHDDIWIVKNDGVQNNLVEKEEEELKAKVTFESAPKVDEDGLKALEVSESLIIGNQAKEGDILPKTDDKDVTSNMTVECPDIRSKQPGLLSPRLEADVERLDLKLNDIEKKRREITEEEQSPEKKAIKEWILSSLGLQSVAAAAAAASVPGRPSKRRSQDGLAPSSGRLKAVIKVPKDSKRDKKSDRKPLRMVFKNGKPHPGATEFSILGGNIEADSTVRVEGNSSSDVGSSIPMINGSDYTTNSTLVLAETIPLPTLEADGKAKPGTNLVIPEKSSSFSIHPGRLCSDVCSYCFGKFGSLDTPCHVAQLKSRERQLKIMTVETQLAMDSCLCDACIRYVDRKANCASSKPQQSHRKEGKNKYEGSMANCSVTGCVQPARHSLRKKWYIKIKKSVMKKCPIDLDLAHHHLPLPLCPEHFSYMEYFMVCGLCKRRLSRSHMYNLSDTRVINMYLEADGIPARLSDKLFVCKLCRYYATLRVKHTGSHSNLSTNQREFFNSYRKRILSSHDIDVSEDEEGGTDPEILNHMANEDAAAVAGSSNALSSNSSALVVTVEESLPKGKRKRAGSNATSSVEGDTGEQPKKKARSTDSSSKSKDARSRERELVPPITISVPEYQPLPQSKNSRSSKAAKSKQDAATSSAMEWISKGFPPFYPGENELALHGKLQFQFDDEPSANRAWEKCSSTLQFDKDTKKLWQELQRPYGSQSSFLRHLVLMERYWRQGELILAPDASAKATSYTRSVQNRLKAYGSTITVKATPEPSKPPQPLLPTAAAPPIPLSVTPISVPRATPEVSTAVGGTVLTAAAAAAAVTAVHLSSSPAPLPSPSSSTTSGEVATLNPPVLAPQPKLQGKAQGKSQPRKSQSSVQTKPQVAQKPSLHVAPQSVKAAKAAKSAKSAKSATGIRVTVKPPTSVQNIMPTSMQQIAVSSGGLSVMSISKAVPVTAGVTISAEPKVASIAERSQLHQGKHQMVLLKPVSTVSSKSPNTSYSSPSRVNSNSWEVTSHPATSRPQFTPLSAPVVNLTRSISLTAVPSSPPSVPDLHPISSEAVSTTRPIRSPSASLPLNSNSMVVASSRGSSGGFVSIIPTSPSKGAHAMSLSQVLNKQASITPIYTSQSLPSSVSVTSSATAVSSVSSPVVLSNDTRTQPAGKVHVTAGGKSFSLTIQQFKKLQQLRQQRQMEQQSKLKRLASKPSKERKVSSTNISPRNQRDDLEVVEVRDSENEGQQESFPTISAVCSGDQAKAMWNEEARTSDFEPNISMSISRPNVEITPIMGAKSDLNVENLPKIPKTLTVTQIRKESPLSKTVSASGMSLTITRQTCQTPIPPQMSSPALDIFPS